MGNDLEVSTNEVEEEPGYVLGQWIGRRQAFGLISAKTAAAEVECLRRIREGKLYRSKCDDWAEFCQKYAGITSSYGNRLIRQLEEFGPSYFDLSRIMRISAEAYRQIAGSVSDAGISFGGEKIAITPENSDKIAEAVHALREQSEAACVPAKPAAKGIASARRRLEACIAELTGMFEGGLADGERAELANAVDAGMQDLKLLSVYLEH
jgi:hypothetical protein